MQMSTESRIFFKLVELLNEHKAYDYNLLSYWDEDRQLVIGIQGKEAEATIDFECNTSFEIELRETEHSLCDQSIAVPLDATDDDLKEIIDRVVTYILNRTVT